MLKILSNVWVGAAKVSSQTSQFKQNKVYIYGNKKTKDKMTIYIKKQLHLTLTYNDLT